MKTLTRILIGIVAGIAIIWLSAFGISKAVEKKHEQPAFVKSMKEFNIVGHRGASFDHPGNTMAAFEQLVKYDPSAILELDVWPTKDGRIVVFHDKTLDETTDGTGKITDITYEELIVLEAGYNISFDGGKTYPFRGKNNWVPLLEQVFRKFRDSLISVEIKYADKGFAEEVMEQAKEYKMEDKVIIGSFSPEIVNFIHENYPGVATSMGSGDVKKFLVLHKLGLEGFFRTKSDAFFVPEFSDSDQPEYLGDDVEQGIRVISEGFIKDAQRLGFPVFAWTINRKENMKRLYEWGIDGIITDDPGSLKEIVDKKK